MFLLTYLQKVTPERELYACALLEFFQYGWQKITYTERRVNAPVHMQSMEQGQKGLWENIFMD